MGKAPNILYGVTSQTSDGYSHSSQLNLGLLNVCGLKRRSLFPEFIELIHKFDLFFVTETKIDITDIIQGDGYTFYSKPRQQTYVRKSGGIGIFAKNDLSKYIEILNSDSDYILWVKINKTYTKLDQHIIIGVIYVPPSQSRYLNEDEFELFQNEITDTCSKFDYVYLAGDMNAQTTDLIDYTSKDEFLNKFFDFDEEIIMFYDKKTTLENFGIQVNRRSVDKKKNNNGFKLIDICKNKLASLKRIQ